MTEEKGFSLKKGWLLIALAALVAVLGLLVYRDLSLEIPVPPASEEGQSHVEIQQIEVERQFDGDLWRLKAPITVQQGEETEVRSADIRVVTSAGEKLDLRTPRGHFDQDMEGGRLERPEGRMSGEGFSYDWQAGRADWDGRERQWKLSGGVLLEGRGLTMEARSGTLLPGGNVRLEEEVRVQWRYDAPDD